MRRTRKSSCVSRGRPKRKAASRSGRCAAKTGRGRRKDPPSEPEQQGPRPPRKR